MDREPNHPPAGTTSGVIDDPEVLVRVVRPMLERRDVPGLLGLVGGPLCEKRMCNFLSCPHADARKVAALTLGLVGTHRSIGLLAEHLRDPDPMVNEMAEHALWSIWFRGGSRRANEQLLLGSQALDAQELDAACGHFCRAIEFCPTFAEAYNQRAIVHYLHERFDRSLDDCLRAAEFMPCHFGAWSGVGHCQASLGRRKEALAAYQRALDINPHLDCVRDIIDQLESGCGR